MGLKINKKKAAPTSVTKAAVKTTTSVAHSKTGAEVVKEEIQSMAEVPSLHANVGITAARTINLGEFNSVKLGVAIYFPCPATKEAVDATYDFCVAWVDEKMTALTKDHDPPADE